MFDWIFKRRIPLIRAATCLFFICGILLSFTVWHSDRLFPTLPIIEGFPQFPADISSFLAVLLILGLILGAFIKQRAYFIALLLLLLLLLLQDQMRWQPWVYMYLAFLMPFALWKNPSEYLLPYFQFILIGVYFWSGFYKFGDGFIDATFDKMLRTLFFIEDAGTRESLRFLGYGIPLIEMGIAIGLLFRKTRNVSVLFAVLSHILILSYLIINEQNTVVYPWNMAMIVLAILSFYNTQNSLKFWNASSMRLKAMSAAGALFFLILPATSPLGIWDKYLSFKLYSGTNGTWCVGLDKDQYKKIDPALQAYFWKVDEPNGKYWIYVNLWAFDELNISFYPEIRTFKQLGKTFCESGIPGEKLKFVKFQKGFGREGAEVFGCEDCE